MPQGRGQLSHPRRHLLSLPGLTAPTVQGAPGGVGTDSHQGGSGGFTGAILVNPHKCEVGRTAPILLIGRFIHRGSSVVYNHGLTQLPLQPPL